MAHLCQFGAALRVVGIPRGEDDADRDDGLEGRRGDINEGLHGVTGAQSALWAGSSYATISSRPSCPFQALDRCRCDRTCLHIETRGSLRPARRRIGHVRVPPTPRSGWCCHHRSHRMRPFPCPPPPPPDIPTRPLWAATVALRIGGCGRDHNIPSLSSIHLSHTRPIHTHPRKENRQSRTRPRTQDAIQDDQAERRQGDPGNRVRDVEDPQGALRGGGRAGDRGGVRSRRYGAG